MRKKSDEKQKQRTSLLDRLRQIDLPSALQRRVWIQYLAAVGLTLAILVMGGYYHNPTYLIGLLIPVALVFLGVTTTMEYDEGKILEVPVVCTSSETFRLRDTTHVVFRTDEEVPQYFSFVVPGKNQQEKFIPNSSYVIYFREDRPHELIGFLQL